MVERGTIKRLALMSIVLASFAVVWPSQAVSLCDFRSPTTDLTNLFLTMNFAYLDLPDTPQVDVSSGRISFSFSHIHDEPARSFSAGSTSEVSFDHLHLSRLFGDAYLTTRSYNSSEAPIYFFAEVKADYTSAAAQSGLELRLGSGYGRLTDVSPLARALRIEGVLTDDLLLPSPLSEDALQTIGQLIARESEFSGISELVSLIADVIEAEANVLLSARSLLAIAEQIRATTVSQQCGWATQIGLGYELVRRFGSSRLVLLTLSTDMARPLSLASQVGVHADFSYPLFASDASALSASAIYSRRLSDNTRLVAEASLQRVQKIGESPIVGENLEVQLLFDLGRMDITATASLARGTGMAGWIESLTIAASIDLL
jgi:hypothetical protein